MHRPVTPSSREAVAGPAALADRRARAARADGARPADPRRDRRRRRASPSRRSPRACAGCARPAARRHRRTDHAGAGGSGSYYALADDVGTALVSSIAPDGVVAEVAGPVTVTVLARARSIAARPRRRAGREAARRAGPSGAAGDCRTQAGSGSAVVSAADPVDRATGRLVHLPDAPFLVGDLDPVAVLAPLVAGPVTGRQRRQLGRPGRARRRRRRAGRLRLPPPRRGPRLRRRQRRRGPPRAPRPGRRDRPRRHHRPGRPGDPV